MSQDLSRFLEPTREAIRQDWQRIGARPVLAPGQRQESFLPVEVVLCFGLFFILNPHSYGGANIHTVPAAVHALAATFRRSAGSITNKMLNLDGSRKNGGFQEPELYLRLSGSPDLFVELYRRIVLGAREQGMGEAQVPDFLNLCDHAHLILLGQEELGERELAQVLEEERDYILDHAHAWGIAARETERLVVQKARIGQHRFAHQVLENYEHACGFCGFAPGPELHEQGLLIASHIKPWRDSTERERLDPRNGIAACPLHDVAFDRGLLTVNGGLRIHRAEALEARLGRDAQAARYFGEGIAARLIVPDKRLGPERRYLEYHREHIFLGAQAS